MIMRLLPAVLLGSTLGLLPPGAGAAGGIEDGPRDVEHPAWMSPGLVDLETDVETVRAEGRTGVFVLFTTQGCSYCAAFIRESLGDPALQRKLREHFVTVGLEIFDDVLMTDPFGEELPIKRFAERQRADMAPTLLFFAPSGELMFRAVGYQAPARFDRMLDYLVGGHHFETGFRDYLVAADPPGGDRRGEPIPLREDPLFEPPPYALARNAFPATEPLLVLFEAPDCAACAAFHDRVLALDAVRERLQRFEVVRLNAADDQGPVLAVDGTRTTAADWYAREGFSRLPALLFADEHGRVVFKTDAVIERQRMLNATGLVLERAYEKGWSYQRYARTQAIERNRAAAEAARP